MHVLNLIPFLLGMPTHILSSVEFNTHLKHDRQIWHAMFRTCPILFPSRPHRLSDQFFNDSKNLCDNNEQSLNIQKFLILPGGILCPYIWTALYRFWAHLFWMPKLVNIVISCKYFSFLAYQRSMQLLYETFDTLIEDLAAFTARQS